MRWIKSFVTSKGTPMSKVMEIGMPGSFDPVFGIIAYRHYQLMEPLYVIVWKNTGEQVIGTGGFENPISAENYVSSNRIALLNEEIENILLINK